MMKSKRTILEASIAFAIVAILIAAFFPREGKFRYRFHEGKPWRYNLLTAPTDIPIYKTDVEVAAEKDSIRHHFIPYYRIDSAKAAQQIALFRNAVQRSGQPSGSAETKYVERLLERIYAVGILYTQERDRLTADGHERINILNGTLSETKLLKTLYTTRTAYEAIVADAPAQIDREALKRLNLNLYLVENVTYDAAMSDRILAERLQRVPLSTGLIQAGERIVDRGDIIDGRTYAALRSFKIMYETASGGTRRHTTLWAGQLILVGGLLFCCAAYLAIFCPSIFYNRRNLMFVLMLLAGFGLLSEVVIRYNLANLYVVPYAIIPIVMRTFFKSHTAALIVHSVTVMIASLSAPFPHEFLLMQMAIGVITIVSLREMTQRSQLLSSSFYIFLTYVLMFLSLSLYQEGDWDRIEWTTLSAFVINLVLLMFSYVLIYLLEKIFGYVSSITLVELSNINTPILQRLSETAPGTFQHSLNVSILAADAASRIGADAQLVRTGALYHDIGKMANPTYYTENQRAGAFNPHNGLPFEESAQIIIGHVTEGIRMAEKAKLPAAIIDFIRTHHGRSKTRYFYNSYRNAYPDRPVDESLFTYAGPNPTTREGGLLMMADSVEAASRSLAEYTEETISELVEKIIDGQINEQLLRNTPLTFHDIDTIKHTFIEKLKTMNHTRISYPDLKQKTS